MSTNISHRLDPSPIRSAGTLTTPWLAAAVGIPALALALASVAPISMVLPLLAAVTVVCGFAVAGVGLMCNPAGSPAREQVLMLAGALVMIGFAATILTDSAEVAALLTTEARQ